MGLFDFFKKMNAVEGKIIPDGQMTTLEMTYQDVGYYIVTGCYQKTGDGGKLIQVDPSKVFSECEDFKSILCSRDKEHLLKFIRNNFTIDELVTIK